MLHQLNALLKLLYFLWCHALLSIKHSFLQVNFNVIILYSLAFVVIGPIIVIVTLKFVSQFIQGINSKTPVIEILT